MSNKKILNLDFSKYLKYKNKYLDLKLNQKGGVHFKNIQNEDERDKVCVVCMEEFYTPSSGKFVVLLKCGHILCNCYFIGGYKLSECPICRENFVPLHFLSPEKYKILIWLLKTKLSILDFIKKNDQMYVPSFMKTYEDTIYTQPELLMIHTTFTIPNKIQERVILRYDDNIVKFIANLYDTNSEDIIVTITGTNIVIPIGLTPVDVIDIVNKHTHLYLTINIIDSDDL